MRVNFAKSFAFVAEDTENGGVKTVLLLLDNPREAEFAKTILTKTGFDVLSRQFGISSKLQQKLPDVVFISNLASDKTVVEQLIKLKTKNGIPKFIWVGAKERLKKMDEETRIIIDASLDTPIQPEKMLELICLQTGLNVDEVIQHYRSLYLRSLDKANTKKKVDTERSDRYKTILEGVEAKDTVLTLKDLKKRSLPQAGDQNTQTLLEQKKEFLKTLFKK